MLTEAALYSRETECMSELIKKPTLLYSLSQELRTSVEELARLEKKLAVVNRLLPEVNDQVVILKLEKEKEGFEKQKTDLSISIKKLESITGSIKDFTLFYIFIKRFHTLAVQKENFEHASKKISLKLIGNLKAEEETLYHEYIEGDCFSKVLQVFSFESYQCYFQDYAKNFFDNICHSSDLYVNSLLSLSAVSNECTYFDRDNFDLTKIKFFLSKNIPADVPLPNTNYELVALCCFFYYEILSEYLKLKPVTTNCEHLKKSINLELRIVNYKANAQSTLIFRLDGLQKSLHRIEKKLNDFLEKATAEDKEADINESLVFFRILENEIQTINKTNKNLINKYNSSTSMRHLLAIIVNEAHLPKFLELFNAKIGKDFSLNTMKRSEYLVTNKDLLNHLFHTICRDGFYIPLTETINSFIIELIEKYPKEDTSALDNLELGDLIEFSFYYIFTLRYTDFNATLNAFNNKLLYSEMVAFNIFCNIKLEALEKLEKQKNIEINQFLKTSFKNEKEFCRHKKNILEEIRLSLEVIQDTQRILSGIKGLETALTPKMKSSLVPMPEKDLLINSIRILEKKRKTCELVFKKIEKHKFIPEINEFQIKLERDKKYNKAIKYFSKSLTCLLENLSESLKIIKANTCDINHFQQKISPAIDQVSLSMNKLASSLSIWKNTNETLDLTSLNLSKLLEIAEEFLFKNDLIKKKSYQEKLAEWKALLNRSIELLDHHVEVIIEKYQNFNTEAPEIINVLSSSFKKRTRAQFFNNPPINKKLFSDYLLLKEQSNWLEKLISSINGNTTDRVIKLYSIMLAADGYYKTCQLFNKKNICKSFNKSKPTLKPKKPYKGNKKIDLSSGKSKEVISGSLSDAQTVIESPEKNLLNITVLQNYEIWNLEFEKWKSEKHKQLYELFHIIESCSKLVLNTSGHAFLKYLSLYHKEFVDKNDELRKHKSEILVYFKDSEKNRLIHCCLNQYQKWFDEIFQRIIFSEKLIRQDKRNSVVQESPYLPSTWADNRAKFKELLTFYLGATDKYNKFRHNLIDEENKLNNLNRNFIKQILKLGSLDEINSEANVLFDFSKQLDSVKQLKLAIEQEFETKQRVKNKLLLIAKPEIVKFYLNRIDPYDADSLEIAENHFPLQSTITTSYVVPTLPMPQEYNVCTTAAFFYPSVVSVGVGQPHSQTFYSM